MGVGRGAVQAYRMSAIDKLERAGLIRSRSTAALTRYALATGLVTGTI